jgi:hypothetical protein
MYGFDLWVAREVRAVQGENLGDFMDNHGSGQK